MFYIGCHLSLTGGYLNMGKVAKSIGANAFQYFTKNPRGRSSKEADPADVAALAAFLKEEGFAPPLAHAPYTYNPSSADERIREYTVTSMRGELEFLEALPGSLYNFHPGNHVGAGAEEGIRRTAALLNEIMFEGMSTTVLIETMAGKGTEIGRTFEEVQSIIEQVEPRFRDNVGVCLDTCHVSDGGYDIAGDTDAVVDEFDRVIGLDRLHAIHLNDSKNPLGAHKDRHEKIGDGTIALDGITSIITNPKIMHLPFYLETPNEVEGYAREIAMLREIRKD
ncbi:MAG: deoxyribonuclease IV [Ruminococcaceae bacterium]|nr:deoxyribonuclease IV [Oscillospiraceae bacterium]